MKRSMHFPGKRECLPMLPRLRAARAPDLTFLFFFLSLYLLAPHLLVLHSLAAAQENTTEDQVKAAYLLNFAKLAEWPASALPEGPSPLVIGVSGGDEDPGPGPAAGAPVVHVRGLAYKGLVEVSCLRSVTVSDIMTT